eukprot:s7382_g3.t2
MPAAYPEPLGSQKVPCRTAGLLPAVRLFGCIAAICVACPKGSRPLRGYWQAPDSDQGSESQQYTVTVRVAAKDAFRREAPRLDASFIPPGHSESQRVTMYFPGTDDNAQTMMPSGLRDGASANISGYAGDATQARALKASKLDQGLVMGLYAANIQPEESDTRSVFVVSSIQCERNVGQLTDSRRGRSLGNAAAKNTAVVVLYEPCQEALSPETIKDRLQSAFFESTFQPSAGRLLSRYSQLLRHSRRPFPWLPGFDGCLGYLQKRSATAKSSTLGPTTTTTTKMIDFRGGCMVAVLQ